MAKDPRKYVSESHDLSKIAPKFHEVALEILLDLEKQGYDPFYFEAVRTKERQWWIYGTGRDFTECTEAGVPTQYSWAKAGYRATNASSYLTSVHGHGLALDCLSKSKMWGAPESFWNALGKSVVKHGLTWGGSWKSPVDRPHFQWPLKRAGIIYAGPSRQDRERTANEGMEATWKYYGAI